jgi:hypothetical protein
MENAMDPTGNKYHIMEQHTCSIGWNDGEKRNEVIRRRNKEIM